MTIVPRLRVTGHYAGAVSRAASGALDIAIVLATFTAGLAGLDLLARAVLDVSLAGDRTGAGSVVAFALWAFTYVYTSLAIAGRTPGKGIVGLRVVRADGSTLSGRRAFWRTLALPLSVLPLGLGFVGIIVQREHRALHDLIAGTVVVYDWGGRVAELPGPLSEFLARQAGAEYSARPPTVDGDR
jgi:uncharacterized RDD family membrane protein YckC